MITVDQFFTQWDDRYLKSAQGIGGQCVDVYNQYCVDVIGTTPPLVASAYQIFTNYPTSYFDAITNTPTGIPTKGDIMVWGQGLGADGHVAIFEEGNENAFASFDQNFPTGSNCHFQTHNYDSVTGWLHPKQPGTYVDAATFGKLVSESSKYEDFVKIGYTQASDVTTRLTQLQSQISGLNTQVGDLTKQNQALVVEIQQTKDLLAKQADLTQQQATTDSAAITAGQIASGQVKTLQADIQAIATQLNTQPIKDAIIAAVVVLQNQKTAAEIQTTTTVQNSQTVINWILNIFAKKKVK